MIIQKHGYKIVTDIANNRALKKDIQEYRDRIPYNLNDKIFIIEDDRFSLDGYMHIDTCYMDDKLYANGNTKTSRELRHLLENVIDGLTECDMYLLRKVLVHRAERYHFSNFLNFTHNNTNPIHNECVAWNYANSNNIDYEIRKITLYDSDDVVFGQSKKECEYTGYFCNFFTMFNNVYQDIIYMNNRYISRDYYEDNFYECENCGNEFHNDDMHWETNTEDGSYWDAICDGCYDSLNDNAYSGSIRNYSYKPDAHFRYWDAKKNMIKSEWNPSNKLNIGIEVEMERRTDTSSSDMEKTAYEISQKYDGFFYCKYDGSIRSGFEVVSHPATFNAFRNMDLHDAIFKHNDKFKSFRTGTCGMHIHISRNAFSHAQLHKFILMINEYKALTHLVSQRRNISEYDEWANFSGNLLEDSKYESARKIKRMKRNKDKYDEGFNYQANVFTGSRYQVVNLQNPHTIEIRSFKGNISEIGFRKNLDFIESMFYFCKDASLKDGLNVNKYVDFVRRDRKTYKYLNKFFDLNSNKLKSVLEVPVLLPPSTNN